MKILVLLRHGELARNLEAVLRELAARGHQVHIAVEVKRSGAGLLTALTLEHPNLSHGRAPDRGDEWVAIARILRRSIDFLRYLEPEFREARRLRGRARRGTARWVLSLSDHGALRRRRLRAALAAALRAGEVAIPPSPRIERFLRKQAPDVLMVTPLVDGVSQPDYVRAARALGIPTALPVASWDNLTNKGLIRDVPDRVYVWNDDQRSEAVDLHGVAPSRVVVVGAHTYDHWFAWRPSRDREEFCRILGFDPARPFLLYVCSSNFIGSHSRGVFERDFVGRWMAEVRRRGGEGLASARVLVRPHPMAAGQWTDPERPPEPAGMVVHPREGADPTTPEAKRDYFDALFHSAGVVGLNTSAMIEAAIVGRRTFTVLVPEYRDQQGGTLHFHHLARREGGLLAVAGDFAEHAHQLEEVLSRPQAGDDRGRAFLRRFVRPHGLRRPAAPLLVDDLEALAAARVPRAGRSLPQRVLGAALHPLARRIGRTWRPPGAELKTPRLG